ncbi:S-layer homology domain-containing protein [Candidatus Saganbacteria bacterium]|uniref:S-layer homology domain-containing protein n=1 Tax=Candidatus Saganbacteria bacterium TaxID=2575572 RepID=A0A9D6UMQ6_UNCSA|nr:S-layer homology domain-containing protein [Candidatus Saganbacteria bacterium]
MKKIFLMVFISGVFTTLAGADVKMRDVPPDHWAASAVYDLIKLGVTKGYPDGTFRGNKPINRYETAIFLSKLAKALSGQDFKTDIKTLRDQITDLEKENKENLSVTGSYAGGWKAGNLLTAKGGVRGVVGSYRLILSGRREFDQNGALKIGLDTMDYGYFDDGSAAAAGRGLLASELLDIESEWRFNLADRPLNLKLTYGSGPKRHRADPTGILTSEVDVTYIRPNTGIAASTRLLGADVFLGYYSLMGAFNIDGRVNASQLTGSVAFNLPSVLKFFRLVLTGDYVARGLLSPAAKDVRARVDLSLPLNEKLQASGTLGVAGRESSDLMVSGALSINDPWDTGTVVSLKMAKIGSSYITPAFAGEEFYFAGYDNFNRPLVGGTVQVGGALTQIVSDKVRLAGRGDLRLAGDYKYAGADARLTAEGGISYDLAPGATLDASYRVHHDKGTSTTSDVAAVGLLYRF